MIIAKILLYGFSVLMGLGAIVVIFHGGEKDGICTYDYKEETKK